VSKPRAVGLLAVCPTVKPVGRLRYIAGTAWSAKCYMNMRPLYQPQVTQTDAVA
jgi:hypothetical protein